MPVDSCRFTRSEYQHRYPASDALSVTSGIRLAFRRHSAAVHKLGFYFGSETLSGCAGYCQGAWLPVTSSELSDYRLTATMTPGSRGQAQCPYSFNCISFSLHASGFTFYKSSKKIFAAEIARSLVLPRVPSLLIMLSFLLPAGWLSGFSL